MPSNSTLPADLPLPLVKLAEEASNSGMELDVSIAGIPFLIKMSDQFPLVRQLVEDKREQFDNSGLNGEQTFGYWWLRSAPSFHGGAGQDFADTGVVNPDLSRVRYAESSGLFPFEPGELSVAPALAYVTSGATHIAAHPVTRAGVERVAVLRSTNRIDFYDMAGALAGFAALPAGTPLAMASDGARLFVVIADKIVRVNPDDTVTTIATITLSAPVALGYSKQRLVFGHGRQLFEVATDPGSPVALGTPHYSHPNPLWRWNVIADGPTAIFAAGFAGAVSRVFSLTEQESAGTLVLGAPIEQATLPTGERVLSMLFYVNSLVLLGTTAGLRIGTFTPYAQVVWGPESIPGVPVSSLSAIGSTVLATSDQAFYWLDLGSPADQVGRYAYAKRANVAAPVAVVAAGTPAKPFVVTGTAVGHEDTTVPAQGSLTSSWITFGTTERKRLFYVAVSGEFAGLGVTVVVESRDGLTETFAIPGAATQDVFEFGVSLPESDAYRVTVNMSRSGSGARTVIRSWQMKSLPTPRRYQQIAYPLWTEDDIRTSNGERIGYSGFAVDSLNALESLARRNAVVEVQDHLLAQRYKCQIRDVQFRQVAGPERDRRVGGITTVIVTAVT